MKFCLICAKVVKKRKQNEFGWLLFIYLQVCALKRKVGYEITLLRYFIRFDVIAAMRQPLTKKRSRSLRQINLWVAAQNTPRRKVSAVYPVGSNISCVQDRGQVSDFNPRVYPFRLDLLDKFWVFLPTYFLVDIIFALIIPDILSKIRNKPKIKLDK